MTPYHKKRLTGMVWSPPLIVCCKQMREEGTVGLLVNFSHSEWVTSTNLSRTAIGRYSTTGAMELAHSLHPRPAKYYNIPTLGLYCMASAT